MLGRSVGLVLACALGAESFLLPPNVTPEDVNALSINTVPKQPDQAIVQLPCSECAFSGTKDRVEIDEDDEDGLVWIQGGANNVVINLTVSEDGERLQANGETIYPLSFQLEDIFHSPKIYVNEVPSTASVEDIVSGNARTTPLEVTGHGVTVLEEEAITDDGDVLVPIRFNIYELEHQLVSLDEVTIQVLKNGKHGLMILQAFGTPKTTTGLIPDTFFGPSESSVESVVPAPPSKDGPPGPPPADFGKHKECKNLPAVLCKFKTMVEDKIMGMKKGGCRGRKGGRPHGGKMPGHHRPPPFPRPEDFPEDAPEKPHHHGRPHHMRPHGHHHEHHHHHRHHFLHAFTRGLAAVLIPTMAGVAVGMTVSLLGLLVGRLIGFLWIKLYRGGRRGYASVALDESTADKFDAEKEVVVHEESEEALPVYEQAPAYEEAVNETK